MSAENSAHVQLATVERISDSNDVLGIERPFGQFMYSSGSLLGVVGDRERRRVSRFAK